MTHEIRIPKPNGNPPSGSERPIKRARQFFTSENRILLFIVLAISVSFLIVAYGIYSSYQSTLEDNYSKFNGMMTNVIAKGISERLISPFNATEKVNQFIDDMLATSEDIVSIEVKPSRGEPITGTKNLPKEAQEKVDDISAPMVVTDDGLRQEIGVVHVHFAKKTLRDIKAATSNIIFWVFMSAWFTSILAVSLNTYILSKHLRTFVRGVKRLSTGDFGYKILEHDLWGELRTLAESFNDMSMRLRAYEDQNLETITFERNKLKAMLLSIADGVVVCDTSGKITIINDSACQMLGFKTSSWAIDTSIVDYVTVEGDKCFEPLMREFGTVVADHQGHLPEGFTKAVELPERALKITISPIQDLEGDTLGLVMIMHDVTKEIEVDKLKTNFISNVSHELRTPVTTIKSYVDTIYNHGKDLDSDTYQEFVETINTETDRLKKLVNDILDFSRLDEGAVAIEKEWADIAPVINLTVQSIKVLAEQKNINLSTAIESDLPKVYMNSDTIERVIRNLLSNAIKYTPEGGRIRVRAELSEDGDMLNVSVQDTGIGIPSEHLPYLFDRFYRVETKVHTVKGTGLGLHLVRVAVETHHQGEVYVKSEVGVGSTFGFKLPIKEPNENLKAAARKPAGKAID